MQRPMLILYKTPSSRGLDVSNYILEDGLKRVREDLDGPNAGRTKTGTMIRDRRASKIRLDTEFRPILDSEYAPVLDIIEEEYCWATYYDARLGWREKVKFYSNNNPCTAQTEMPDGTIRFSGISFFLSEV